MTKPIGIIICILAGLAGYFVTNHNNQREEISPQRKVLKAHKKPLIENKKKAVKMNQAPIEIHSLFEAEARLEEKKII